MISNGKLILFSSIFSAQLALADIQPVNPNANGMVIGDQSVKPMTSLTLSRGVGSDLTDNGRYLVFSTQTPSMNDDTALDFYLHRYDSQSGQLISSDVLLTQQLSAGLSFSLLEFSSNDGNKVVVTHESNPGTGLEISSYAYDFEQKELTDYQRNSHSVWSVSANFAYSLEHTREEYRIYELHSDDYWSLPTEITVGEESAEIEENLGAHGNHVNNVGELVVRTNQNDWNKEGISPYYIFNAPNNELTAVGNYLPQELNAAVTDGLVHNPVLSDSGRYMLLQAEDEDQASLLVLVDRQNDQLYTVESPSVVEGYGGILPRRVTDNGIGQFIIHDTDRIEFYLYDFLNSKVLDHDVLNDAEIPDLPEFTAFDHITSDGGAATGYQVKITDIEVPEFDIELFWTDSLVDEASGNTVKVIPATSVIDPYDNPTTQLEIQVSGSDMFGLDIECTLDNENLSISDADYSNIFGSKNSVKFPISYDAQAFKGIEILLAPESPFEGSGVFMIADVVAQYTTTDVSINCLAILSDADGNLLPVNVEPGIIHIDDGIHGGTASVSGTIAIPGGVDVSGIEVTLSIGGRQVVTHTDANGNYEFTDLRDGEFTVSFSAENYVQSCQQASVSEGGSIELGELELLAGDVNSDGVIDIADFTYLSAKYDTKAGDPDYDAKADLNNDGTINIQDLAILGSHFGSTQCNIAE